MYCNPDISLIREFITLSIDSTGDFLIERRTGVYGRLKKISRRIK